MDEATDSENSPAHYRCVKKMNEQFIMLDDNISYKYIHNPDQKMRISQAIYRNMSHTKAMEKYYIKIDKMTEYSDYVDRNKKYVNGKYTLLSELHYKDHLLHKSIITKF